MMQRIVRSFGTALLLAFAIPGASLADVVVRDPYVRQAHPNAPAAAAFMVIDNTATAPDRLVSVVSDIANRVELHTHVDAGGGIMKMTEIEGGIEIPASGSHVLQRGGDHVMFMGLNTALQQGDMVTVILTFEQAGDVTVVIPVDNTRQP